MMPYLFKFLLYFYQPPQTYREVANTVQKNVFPEPFKSKLTPDDPSNPNASLCISTNKDILLRNCHATTSTMILAVTRHRRTLRLHSSFASCPKNGLYGERIQFMVTH